MQKNNSNAFICVVMEIKEIINAIEEDIQSIKYKQEPSFLYEPIAYTLEKGGKRMRPLLMSLVYLLYKDNLKNVLPLCRCIEVFHNFTLLHDDIMDNAPIRRGNPTVHKKWNNNIAILSGDVMLVQSYQYLQSLETNNLSELLSVFNQGAIKVCEGQQYDMNFEEMNNVSVENYIEMIYLKTAALLDHSIEMTAIFAEAPQNDIDNLKIFAKNIGIAFQLKDDLLDVFADASKFGKQVGGDILANKKTFLLLKSIELANKEQRFTFNYWLNNTTQPEQKIQEIRHLYNTLNIQEITSTLISEYFSKGMNALQRVNSSKKEKQLLTNYIENLMQREQ